MTSSPKLPYHGSMGYAFKYLVLFNFFLTGLTTGCVTYDNFDTTTAQGAFGLGKQLEEDERFEEALAQYGQVKNRFPYSQYKVAAELQIAEIQFKREFFPQAQAAYELFKELHPKHPRIDYIQFQIGESLFQQLPSTVDRDLSLGPQVIAQFDLLLRDYPGSKYGKKARERREETRNKLAGKELYIADFYFRTDEWKPAVVRYEKYLREFPGHHKQAHAYYQAGIAAGNAGDETKRRTLLRRLIDKYPNTEEAKKAREVL